MTWDLINAFKELDNNGGWLPCRKCGEFPRVWEFNNGKSADCMCGEKYGESPVRTESIMSFVTRNNGRALGYHSDKLKSAWNKYIKTGEKQNKLPDGRW